MVNGATRWRAFWQIAVPLARPAVLAVGLLAFIFSWNEFLLCLDPHPRQCDHLPFTLPVLMEGHDVWWGDIAAIAPWSRPAGCVILRLRVAEISRARSLVWHGALRRGPDWYAPVKRAVSEQSAATFVASVRVSAMASLAEAHDDGRCRPRGVRSPPAEASRPEFRL